jgi:phage gp36-like protein
VAYCAKDDILLLIGENELIRCTDDEDTGAVDDAVVARAIADADNEIDAYLGKRHAVPLTIVPDLVRKLSGDITAYNLYSRRIGPPEFRVQRYEQAISKLREARDGKLSLGEKDPETPPSTSEAPSISSSPQVFTRDSMKGF